MLVALAEGLLVAYMVVHTTKRSVGGLRCMALALAPHGIRVNAIGPGSIMTEVLQSVVKDKAALSKCAGKLHDIVPRSAQGMLGASCGMCSMGIADMKDQVGYHGKAASGAAILAANKLQTCMKLEGSSLVHTCLNLTALAGC